MQALRQSVTAAILGGVFLCGCAAERHRDIPASAPLVTKGTDAITYTPTEDGMIYVSDKSVGRLLYSGQVRANQQVSIDPESDKIQVGGQTVSEAKMRRGNEHRVFFMPMANTTTGSGTTSMSGSGATMSDGGVAPGTVYQRTSETTIRQETR
jgi:hypothetical protein